MSNKMNQEIQILYEDEDIVVINKPSGIMVHSDGRSAGPFITDWVLEKYPQMKGIGEPSRSQDGAEIDRPGIVHRLDRETSGVLILAKNAESHENLKRQFQNRTVQKKYLAFVWGELKEEFGTITRPIGRSGNDFRKWSAGRGKRGDAREAETYWTKLDTKTLENNNELKFTLVEAQPKTGRTHQIRVHFASIQHPVVGDTLYAPKRFSALGFERTALHSWFISFETRNEKKVTVKAPLPDDFTRACHLLGINEPKS